MGLNEQYVTEKKPFWKSKKWMTSLIAALVPVVNATFGLELDPAEVITVVVPLVIYVLAQGQVDAKH